MVFQKVPARVEPGLPTVTPAPAAVPTSAAIPAPTPAEADESAAPEPEMVPNLTDPTGSADPGPRLDGVRLVMVNWRDPWQSTAGGAEEYAWQISRHLAERGAIVTFLTSREPHQARVETKDGIVIRRMGGKFTVYPRVMAWLALWRREYHIAFDCMNGIPFFSRLVLRRRTRVVSVVHHVHDLQFNAYFSAPLAWFGRFLESTVASWIYRNCTTVTVSESSRVAMRDKLGWRAPIEIVHNGGPPVTLHHPQPSPAAQPLSGPVALHHPQPSPAAQPLSDVPPAMAAVGPAPDAAPALVSLGRLVVQKRVSRVVDLARTLGDDHPGLRVHIIGRGPEGEHLEEQIGRDGLQSQVDLHGFLSEEDKNSVLASCHLHVTASEFEGWGLTVIEAARLGVPTVAYDVDGLRDSVRDGETGWLVREGETIEDVVSRALKELSDPRRAEEVRRACRAWASQFTWEASGARMTRLVAAELDLDTTQGAPAGTSAGPPDPTAGKKAKM